MKIIIGCCAAYFAWVSSACGQVTAPAPVDLSYHFKPGTTLNYQRLDEFRNPENPMGYSEGNWDLKENIHITVEKVEPNGSATLLVRIEEKDDLKGEENGTRGMTTHADDIPLYRVTIDRFGNYLNGEILRRSVKDSIIREKMKDPKFIGSSMSDSSRIKLSMDNAFCSRPARGRAQVGMKWSDTSCQISHPHLYPKGHSVSTATASPPDTSPSYNSHHFDYKIVQSAADRDSSQCHLATSSMNYQVGMGMLMSQWTSDEDQDIRSSDGLATQRTRLERRIGGVMVDKSYTKRTLTLISVDSVAK